MCEGLRRVPLCLVEMREFLEPDLTGTEVEQGNKDGHGDTTPSGFTAEPRATKEAGPRAALA